MEPDASRGRPKVHIAFLAAIALISVCAVTQSWLVKPQVHRDPFFDETRFKLYATNLLDRGFFGDEAGKWPATVELRSVGYSAYLPPGYPFFLAALRGTFWGGNGPIRAAQAILVGITVAAASLIALRLFGKPAAITTGILMVATATLATYSQFALSEILATASLVVALFFVLIAYDRRSWPLMAGAGVVLGLSALTRPQVLLLAIPLGVWVFFGAGRNRGSMVVALALIAGVVIAVGPWMIRNYVRLHALVPVATYSGVSFWIANNPHADGYFRRPEVWIGADEVRRIRSLPEVEQDATWRHMALTWIREHPRDAVAGWIRNGRLFVTRSDLLIERWYAIRRRAVPRLDDRLLFPLAAAGVAVLLAVRRFDRRALLIVLTAGYLMAFFSVFQPEPRFRIALVPVLAILAGGLAALGGSHVRSSGRLPRASENRQ
jgi:4-amino-4-deoxy-L-arabinose transferase-like glycosyltransferase